MFFLSKQIDRIMSEDSNRMIIDVRTKNEYASGHIPGAICIPNETISNIEPVHLNDKEQNIIVYCQTGMRASKATKKLKRLGYKNVFNFGGINSWHGDIER
jgi:rhodanese-related sulfurtransferase